MQTQTSGRFAAAPATPAIQATNLTKTFEKRTVVDGLSLKVNPGELYALLGDNGAGKTTTINMLTTQLRPTSGQFSICGFDGVNQAEKTKGAFGVVSQDVAIYGELTAYENLAFIADLYGLPSAEAHKRIEKLLNQSGLADRAHDLAGTFSGGMQRKLSIAISMVHEPRVIFMDEPTVGLDPASRRQIWEALTELKESGVTILLTTHYLEEAEFLADRIGIIRQGKLVLEGTIDELRSHIQAIRTVTVTLDEIFDIDQLTAALARFRDKYPQRLVSFDEFRRTLNFNYSSDVALVSYLNSVLSWLEQEKIPFDRFATTEPNLEEIFLTVQSGKTRN